MIVTYSSEATSTRYLTVNACGKQDLSGADYHTVRASRVDYYLFLVLEGKCTATVGEETFCAEAGSAVLYRPGEKQDFRFDKKDKSKTVWVHFTGVGCEEYLKELAIYDCTHFQVKPTDRLLFALENMVRAKRIEKADRVADGYLMLSLALLSDLREQKNVLRPHAETVASLAEHMADHLCEEKSVAEYAAACHLSPSRFEHIFKEEMGCSPKTYLLQLRISTAKMLLENTVLTGGEIAARVGFEDANYFLRLFRKYTGITPGQYRKEKNMP